MGRRHAEPIDVQRRDDVPAQFVWRSRRYVIKDVLEHWFESGQWWASAPAMALGTGSDAGHESPMKPGHSEAGTAPGPVSIDDGEQEFWRVEAAAGRAGHAGYTPPLGIYDLCFLWSLGSWQLVEVHD
jgi:hypothetical protein